MKVLSVVPAVFLVCSNAMCQTGGAVATSSPYDGEWSVVLDCTDTQDKSGLVKGYQFTFHVTIANGKLQGQYGAKGAPASVVYSGEVGADGTLELRASGNTGSSDQSVGKVARGTAYSYTMAGKLEPSRGQAVRRELRPCTATFGRL
jgi:hypothetical protein